MTAVENLRKCQREVDRVVEIAQIDAGNKSVHFANEFLRYLAASQLYFQLKLLKELQGKEFAKRPAAEADCGKPKIQSADAQSNIGK